MTSCVVLVSDLAVRLGRCIRSHTKVESKTRRCQAYVEVYMLHLCLWYAVYCFVWSLFMYVVPINTSMAYKHQVLRDVHWELLLCSNTNGASKQNETKVSLFNQNAWLLICCWFVYFVETLEGCFISLPLHS